MTKVESKLAVAAAQELLKGNPEGLREIVRAVLQEILEAEMTDALGAAKSERTVARLGYRAGYYGRTLITRVGKLELRVPQDRDGRFSTELFERYQRSEQALVATLAERYVQGVSTRKVKAITEELCGHAFSASAISAINQRLDQSLAAFARRRLEEPFADLILDARDEKVREAGVVCSQAVLIAVGIDWDGRRQILAVELANRESRASWKDFLLSLRERGLPWDGFAVPPLCGRPEGASAFPVAMMQRVVRGLKHRSAVIAVRSGAPLCPAYTGAAAAAGHHGCALARQAPISGTRSWREGIRGVA